MATTSTILKFTDSDSIVRINNTETRTVTGNNMVDTVLPVTTAELTYTIPTTIGAARELIIENNDASATAFVTWGFEATSDQAHAMKVWGGGANKVDLVDATASIFLLADTSTQEIHIVVREK